MVMEAAEGVRPPHLFQIPNFKMEAQILKDSVQFCVVYRKVD